VWFFQLPNNDVVKLVVPYVAKGQPGWHISFNAARTPHGAFATPECLVQAPPGENPQSRLTVSHAIGSEKWDVVTDRKKAGYDAPELGDNPWIDFKAEPCRILESPKKLFVSAVPNTAVPNNNVRSIAPGVPAMSTTSFASADGALQDIVFLNNISVPELSGEDFKRQALGVFEKTETELSKHGMDKHNIVSIMLTLGEIKDVIAFNEIYDAWTTKDLTILPSMSACQLTDFDDGPRLILSVTATKAPKAVLPPELTRSGGGEPVVTGYGPMHCPWSKAVGAGDMVWLCGMLDVGVGDDAKAQARSCLQSVDKTLATAGLSKRSVVHTHIMVPASLSDDEVNDVLAICADYSPENTEVIKAAKTCIDAKVEVTCMASRSPSSYTIL